MSDSAFLLMREQLIVGGLICGATLRLTAAGHAHVAELIERLGEAPEPTGPTAAAIRWDRRRVRRS